MGPICSTCVHSEIHLHYYYVQTLFPIGPAVWPHFSMFWVVDPLKPPEMPPGYWGANCIWPIPFTGESADVYQIGCQSVKPFDSFPKHLNMWPPTPPPPKCPWGIVERIVFSLCLFPDESADGYEHLVPIVAAVWQLTQSFELVTPYPPGNVPWGIGGRNVFSLYPFPDEFAEVYQVTCQSVQQLDCFPRLLNRWPPKTTRRRKCPLGYWGANCI